MNVPAAVEIAVRLDPEATGALLGAFQHAHQFGFRGREAQSAAFSMYSATRDGAAPAGLDTLGGFFDLTTELERHMRPSES